MSSRIRPTELQPLFVAVEQRMDGATPYVIYGCPNDLAKHGSTTAWRPKIGWPIPWGLDPRYSDGEEKPHYRMVVRVIYQLGTIEHHDHILRKKLEELGMRIANHNGNGDPIAVTPSKAEQRLVHAVAMAVTEQFTIAATAKANRGKL